MGRDELRKVSDGNSPSLIYQNSNTAPRSLGKNCKFSTIPYHAIPRRDVWHKENENKFAKMTRKPRSQVRIFYIEPWAIELTTF